MDVSGIATLCAEARQGNLRFREHVGIRALEREQPSSEEIIEALCEDEAKIIEGDPFDTRGRSCLIWGKINLGRVLHLLCGYPPNNWIITVYWPYSEPGDWNIDYDERRIQ